MLTLFTCLWLALPAVAAPTAPLSREALVREALANAPALDAARAEALAAHAQVRAARAPGDPTLTLMLAPMSVRFSPTTHDTTGHTSTLGASALLSQPLAAPSTLYQQGLVAAAQASAKDASTAQLELELAGQAARAAHRWWALQAQLDLLGDHEHALDSLQGPIEARYEAGLGALSALARLDAERAELHALAAETRGAQAELEAQILALTGGDGPLPVPAPLSATPDAALAETPAERQAQAQREAADHASEAAKRARWPELMLMGGYNSMMPGADHRLTVGLSGNLPVWSGRRQAPLDMALAEVQAAAAEAAGVERLTTARQRTSEARLGARRHVLAVVQHELIPAVQAAHRATRDGFIAGQLPLSEVIETHHAELNARGKQITAQADLADAWVDWVVSRGQLSLLLGDAP